MQQKKSDMLYQDAIESNYSHEQITPLNSILFNTTKIYENLSDLKKKGNKSGREYFQEMRKFCNHVEQMTKQIS